MKRNDDDDDEHKNKNNFERAPKNCKRLFTSQTVTYDIYVHRDCVQPKIEIIHQKIAYEPKEQKRERERAGNKNNATYL